MPKSRFKLSIGAKRQVTLPRVFMDLLDLEEGGEILLEVAGDNATLTPIVSIPRADLPEQLRRKFESRRGKEPSDIPLEKFLADVEHGQPLNAGHLKAKEIAHTAVATAVDTIDKADAQPNPNKQRSAD
jgi:bifunctional DNA-binding transcriptional regulator/antitoxin component of YhaV-PrlF toxin-antitoxin module